MLIYRALQTLGEVTALQIREGGSLRLRRTPAPGIAAEIEYSERSLIRKYRRVPAIAPLLRSAIDLDDFDVVVSRYVAPLAALPVFRGRSIIDADDAYYRYPIGSRWYSSFVSAAKTRARVRRGLAVLRRADHVWFSCQRDIEMFSLRSSSILPNAVGNSETTAESVVSSESIVLMVGLMSYPPNRDAVERFIQSCWSGIKRAVPEARFRVVGAAAADWLRRWNSVSGVECVGFVDELTKEYRRARVTVVPIRSGGGTQIKALESLSHGRVPVVSSFVAEGYAPYLKHEEALYIADDPAEQVSRIIELLKTPTKGEAVARYGQQIVRQLFSHGRFLERVASSFASAL